MTPQYILKTDVERTNPNVNWKYMYAKLNIMLQNPNCRLLRANNSLFIIINNQDHTAMVGMHTVDSVEKLIDSMKEFGQAMQKSGFTKLFFTTKRPALIRLVDRAGWKHKVFPSSSGSVIEVLL